MAYLFLIIFTITTLFSSRSSIHAQDDTFGPVCDTLTPGVTCAPSNTPVPTATSTPEAPTETPLPTQPPPVAGNTKITLTLLTLSGIFVLGGLTNIFLSSHQKRQ